MAFEKKTWVDRLSEFAGRRLLTRVSGSADGQMVVDVTRAEGNVSREGDAFSAANMNDLEQRIADEFEEVSNDLGGFSFGTTADGKPGYRKPGADAVTPFMNAYKINCVLSVHLDNSGAAPVNRTHNGYIVVYGDDYKISGLNTGSTYFAALSNTYNISLSIISIEIVNPDDYF